MSESRRSIVGPAFLWATIFAVTAVLQRIVVLAVTAESGPGLLDDLQRAASLPELVLVGLVLALPLMVVHSRLVLSLLWPLVALVVLANGAAVRYEAVFDRLPSAGVLFYAHGGSELAPSLLANAHPWLLAGEMLFILTILVVVRRRLLGQRSSSIDQLPASAALVIVIVLMLLTTTLRFTFDRLAEGYPWRHRSPLVWVVESGLRRAEIGLPDNAVGPQEVLWLQRQLGHRVPFAGALESAPLCASGDRGGASGADERSLIFLILESVGSAELEATYQGRPVMPNLVDFARRHLHFTNLKAAGTKSGSAMAPLFSGQLPQTHEHLLHRVPLNRLDGFPRLLGDRGYRTVYLHGADLSWEFQRSFLRMVGFDEIIERDPRLPHARVGWGWADQLMVERLIEWIGRARSEEPDRPYLATWFSLSSHDPYDLPNSWRRRYSELDAQSRLFESLTYLDYQLGELFRWYETKEASKGTILALVGDHTPHLTHRKDSERGPVFRFDVPLIVAGSSPAITAAEPDWGTRLAAHHDVPATLMQALDLPVPACDQGVSLLSADETWSDDRVVYSVGGEELEEIQLWLPGEHVLADRLFRGLVQLAPGTGGEPSERVRRFLEVILPLNRFLTDSNAYVLERRQAPSRPPLERVSEPLFVSHRGNTEGPAGESENSIQAITEAVSAGFSCVEIDLQLTRDLVPVLHHDHMVVDQEGSERAIAAIDFEDLESIIGQETVTPEEVLDRWPEACFVLETKPQADYDRQAAFGEAVAAVTRARHQRQRLIVDSFSAVQVAATVPSAECEVAWDLPYRSAISDDYLEAAVLAEVEWIFVEVSVLDAEVINRAHQRGLKVMAYTVNQVEDLVRLDPELPDGVITDRAGLQNEFRLTR